MAGEAFLGLGIGYAAIRFVVEFWRGDNPAVWGPLTFSQGIALGIAGVAGITWVVRRRWRKRWGLVEFGKEERGAPLAAPRAR